MNSVGLRLKYSYFNLVKRRDMWETGAGRQERCSVKQDGKPSPSDGPGSGHDAFTEDDQGISSRHIFC